MEDDILKKFEIYLDEKYTSDEERNTQKAYLSDIKLFLKYFEDEFGEKDVNLDMRRITIFGKGRKVREAFINDEIYEALDDYIHDYATTRYEEGYSDMRLKKSLGQTSNAVNRYVHPGGEENRNN